MLINLTWLITCLIVLNVAACRLVSSLSLFKAFACLVIIFWSQWISLAERSQSSFGLVVSCVHVRILLFPTMPMKGVSGKSKLMRVGLPTQTHMHRWLRQDILF
jgi:hypothetical protein